MSYVTPLMSSTPSPGTCAPSFPKTRPPLKSSILLPGEIEPCADPQHVGIGYLAEPKTFTGYEPKLLTEDKGFAERGFMCQTIIFPQTEKNLRFC